MRLPRSTAPILRMASCVNLPAPLLLAQEALDILATTACYQDSDCSTSQFCTAANNKGGPSGHLGTCVGDLGYGYSCNRNNECIYRNCSGGICK